MDGKKARSIQAVFLCVCIFASVVFEELHDFFNLECTILFCTS